MMPIFFIVVAVAAVYCFYLFLQTATPGQMAKLLLVTAVTFAIGFLLLMAVTGRLPTALGILLAAWPIMAAMMDTQRKKIGERHETENDESYAHRMGYKSHTMTREDALEILDVHEGASAQEIQDAYTRLMKQAHPDHGGSDWFAAKLNEARDFLIAEYEKKDDAT